MISGSSVRMRATWFGSCAKRQTNSRPTSAESPRWRPRCKPNRSEEHTSELQSPYDLVCRLLLEKKKKQKRQRSTKANDQAEDVEAENKSAESTRVNQQ